MAASNKKASVGGIEFSNYGSHCNDYPALPYLNAAAAIGQTEGEIHLFLQKLEEAYCKVKASNPVSILKLNAALSPVEEQTNETVEKKEESKEQ